MIGIDLMCAQFSSLDPDDLRRWIAEGHVLAEPTVDDLLFQEIDIERVRLILELRDRLELEEAAIPLVLSLLDQVYALRRRLRRLGADPDGGAN